MGKVFTWVGILYIFVSAQCMAAGIEYIKVPGSCQETLDGVFGKRKNFVVDWTELRDHMFSLGYSKKIVKKKLKQMEIIKEDVRDLFREKLENKNWRMNRQISKKDMLAFAQGDWLSYEVEALLANFPLWAAIPGFDAKVFVQGVLDSEVPLDWDAMAALVLYAPLWLDNESSHELVVAALDSFVGEDGEKDMSILPVILRRLNSEEQKRAYPALRKLVDSDRGYEEPQISIIQGASAIPFDSLSMELQRDVDEYSYVEKYRPEYIPGVETIHCAYRNAGACEEMTNGHLSTLIMSKHINYRENVIVAVRGQVVGSLKFVGDHSFIALRNVVDSAGHLVLSMGGVYHISNRVYEKIVKKYTHISARGSKKKYVVVDLEWLGVHPHTYMMNGETFSLVNMKHWLTLVGSKLSKEKLLEMLWSLVEAKGYAEIDFADQMDLVRGTFLKELHRVRKSVERKMRERPIKKEEAAKNKKGNETRETAVNLWTTPLSESA